MHARILSAGAVSAAVLITLLSCVLTGQPEGSPSPSPTATARVSIASPTAAPATTPPAATTPAAPTAAATTPTATTPPPAQTAPPPPPATAPPPPPATAPPPPPATTAPPPATTAPPAGTAAPNFPGLVLPNATGPVPGGFARYSGRVTDATSGLAVVGACVYTGPPAGCPLGATPRTDINGFFAIDLPGSGWAFTIEHPAYNALLSQTLTPGVQAALVMTRRP